MEEDLGTTFFQVNGKILLGKNLLEDLSVLCMNVSINFNGSWFEIPQISFEHLEFCVLLLSHLKCSTLK